jgi:hypothetical protein
VTLSAPPPLTCPNVGGFFSNWTVLGTASICAALPGTATLTLGEDGIAVLRIDVPGEKVNTLSKRLQDMERRDLITVVTGTDRRTRLVEVGPGGMQVLENRAKLLGEAVAAAERQRKAS